MKVKIVDRPGGVPSGKAEATDVASHRGHVARARLRREAVALALDRPIGTGTQPIGTVMAPVTTRREASEMQARPSGRRASRRDWPRFCRP